MGESGAKRHRSATEETAAKERPAPVGAASAANGTRNALFSRDPFATEVAPTILRSSFATVSETAPTAFVRAALLLAGLLLAASAPAGEAPERTWYQVEVVLVERTDVDTGETFDTDARPAWPRAGLALGPVWPEPVRPRNVGELFALWQDLDAFPGLQQLAPGLTPEAEELIRWLRELDGSGSDPGIGWLPDPEDSAHQGPSGTSVNGNPPAEPESGTGAAATTDEAQGVPLERLALDDVQLELVDAGPPDPEDIPIPMALAFREVAPQEQLLRSEVRRLERAPGYRVLAHRAWRQPFLAEAPALPVMILGEDPATEGVDLVGSVGIALRRYLHARLELYRRVPGIETDLPAPDAAVTGIDPVGPPRPQGIESTGFGLRPAAPEVVDGWIRIVHERRMRSGETHYLDHPRIAVLIRIEPFLLAEPLSEDGAVVRAVRD